MGTALLALIPAISSLALTAVSLPAIRRLADRYGWYDPPDHRKLHSGNICHLGGVGIFVSFALVTIVAGGILSFYSTRLAFLLLGALTLHIIGLVDDLRNLRALPRLIAHLVIAGIVVSGGFLMRAITIPGLGTVEIGWASYPLTILWIAAAVNALNWSDGMDGYAGGIAAFAALGMGIMGLIEGATVTVVMSFTLFGAIVAFLFFNYPPARVFMGDNGATFLGFALAVLPFVENSDPNAGHRMAAIVILLFLPLLDFVTSIIRRLVGGKSPGAPDRGHLHHRLQGLGLRPRQVLAVVYPVCAFLCVVAVGFTHPPSWIPRSVVVVGFVASVVLALLLGIFLSAPRASSSARPTAAGSPPSERRAG